MKKLLLLVTITIFVILTSCENVIETTPPVEPININEIQVPDEFEYETCIVVDVTLLVTSPTDDPVQGIIFKIYDCDPEENGRSIAKGMTQEDGKYETKILVPKGCTAVTVVSPIDTRILPIVNGVLNYEYVDYTKLKSPFTNPKGYNPQTKLTNYCLSFDGANDYVDLEDITELNDVSTFTIEGWVNQSNNTNQDRIFHKFLDDNNDISIAPWAGKFYIEVGNGSNSYAYWNNYSTTISSGTWFHFAAVYDGNGSTNADKVKLYINGSPVLLTFNGTIPSKTSSSLTGVNAYLSYNTSMFFGGYMDEVRVWSVSRSQAEINSNYNKIIDPSMAGLVSYWRMDEGTGATLYDETSNDYDATITGCSWAFYTNGWDSDGDGVNDLNDDYPLDDERAHDNYYPAENIFYTLAFEDKWPRKNDYDFNDIVVYWNYTQVTNAIDELVDIHGSFKLMAVGAGYHDGFGVQFPFEQSNFSDFDDHEDAHQYVDNGTTNAVVILFQDAFNLMQEAAGDPSTWINTVESETYITPAEFEFTYTLGTPLAVDGLSTTPPYNPFIYVNNDRLLEIHLPDYAPTSKMTATPHWGTYDDDSNPATDRYFKTSNNLPWAINIADEWEYPIEKSQITWAYLLFADWAQSGGTVHTDWYDSSVPANINADHIYSSP